MKRLMAILCLTISLAAHAQRHGDWSVVTSVPGMPMASTASGTSEAGFFCVAAGCSAYLVIEGLCGNDGGKFPLLINAPGGSASITATCVNLQGKLWVLVLDDYAGAVGAFGNGGKVGFAAPLASGEFRVIRFSAVGAMPALGEALRISRQGDAKSSPAKADQRL